MNIDPDLSPKANEAGPLEPKPDLVVRRKSTVASKSSHSWSTMKYFWWTKRILSLFVKTRVLPENPQEELSVDIKKPICYVLRSRSLADVLVLSQNCQKAGLPSPIEHVSRIRQSNQPSYAYLTKLGFLQTQRESNKDPSVFMSNLVKKAQDDKTFDLQLVPVSVLWGRNPGKEEKSLLKLLFFDDERAGIFQKFFIVLAQGRNNLLQFGKPISLRQIVDEGQSVEQTAKKLRRVLRVHFRRQRTAVLGPNIYDRVQAIETIVRSKAVRSVIEDEARKAGGVNEASLAKLEAQARRYVDEIAADVTYSVFRFFDVLFTWLWNKLFDGVQVKNAELIQRYAQDHEIVFIPCHRSHLDYMLLSYVVYHNGATPPHTAAGINLNFWPAGPLLRRGGAFFMRRSFRGNRLYTAVFNEYFHFLLTRGHSVTFFPEGGRSRTGRLLQPKTGMITMVAHSFLRNSEKPIVLVPVYIGYDRILEVKSYLKELRGTSKKKESFKSLLKMRHAFKVCYGKAYVSFADPILLAEFFDRERPNWKLESYDDEVRPAWLSETVHGLAENLMTRINSAAVVGPIQLFALVLLSSPQKAMTEEDLISAGDLLLSLAKRLPFSSHISLASDPLRPTLKEAEKYSPIRRFEHPGGDVIYLDERESAQMPYYRNNVLHIYAIPSLIAAFFQHNDEISISAIKDSCQELYPYLQAELFLPWSVHEMNDLIEEVILTMSELGLVSRLQNDTVLRRSSVADREFSSLMVLARILGKTFERYAIAAALLSQHKESGSVSREEFENQCQLTAQRISILSGVNDPEFFDKALFASLVDMLKRFGYLRLLDDGRLGINANITSIAERTMGLLSMDVRQSISRFARPRTSAVASQSTMNASIGQV